MIPQLDTLSAHLTRSSRAHVSPLERRHGLKTREVNLLHHFLNFDAKGSLGA